MKTKTILLLSAIVFAFGCSMLSKKEDLKTFIPGSYLYQGEQEYSKIRDSLVIQDTMGNENLFRITRYTMYNRIKEGAIMPAKLKVQSTLGVYDEKARVIQESKTGRIISFDPDGNRLYVQTQAYEKINR